ncbi:sensor histidine kinase [Comamonas composti]|uniref:sensor histidine kinase n=1 Tax=Comamonas composti TaxID=408558 RepID=UPI0004188006|nr:HAMP domain-containing sensor histidine kinase [Comamonas composti]
MAIHLALLLTLFETLALSGVLLLWARQVAGSRLLVVFLLGVATWIVGNELPNWLGLASVPVSMALLSSLPLTSAAFLHFCVIFCEVALQRRWLIAAYALAALAALLSLLYSPGEFVHFEPFTGLEWVVVPSAVGWTTSLIWAFLAAAGLAVLGWGFVHTSVPLRRKQMAAIAISCAWGLLAMSGFSFAALGIRQYPWQVLLEPLFPLVLVYGVLRWRVFVVNVWARRALASAMLIVLGLLVASLTVLLPVESKWLNAMAVAITCLVLSGPVWRFASRLVYPGGTPSAEDLRHWRSAMAQADSMEQLADIASRLLSARMGTQVLVRADKGLSSSPARTAAALPGLVCSKSGDTWHTTLTGFDEAPPGQQHLAALFGNSLADAAAQVEHAAQALQRERERQQQSRLAELGSLAATVAHDVRNPLNIIAMAVALAPQETRQEVGEQIARISRLTEDLLDYAKPWQVAPVSTDIHERLAALLRHRPGLEAGTQLSRPLHVRVDPMRFDQALGNLLSNACTAAGHQRVLVDTEVLDGAVLVHVCDDGPGIPADLRERLFEPFASRSPGGTGLGLAIVARIMAAHGGSVSAGERAPWRTCFTLSFPLTPAA